MYRLHGNVPQNVRQTVYKDFCKAKSGIMLCTGEITDYSSTETCLAIRTPAAPSTNSAVSDTYLSSSSILCLALPSPSSYFLSLFLLPSSSSSSSSSFPLTYFFLLFLPSPSSSFTFTSFFLFLVDVAARGLDLPEVDWILQYDPPCETTDVSPSSTICVMRFAEVEVLRPSSFCAL